MIENFSNTEYALDAEFKVDYINDILASKEMYLGELFTTKNGYQQLIDLDT